MSGYDFSSLNAAIAICMMRRYFQMKKLNRRGCYSLHAEQIQIMSKNFSFYWMNGNDGTDLRVFVHGRRHQNMFCCVGVVLSGEISFDRGDCVFYMFCCRVAKLVIKVVCVTFIIPAATEMSKQTHQFRRDIN